MPARVASGMRSKPSPVKEDVPLIVAHIPAEADAKAWTEMRLNLLQVAIEVLCSIWGNSACLRACISTLSVVESILFSNPPKKFRIEEKVPPFFHLKAARGVNHAKGFFSLS